MMARHFCELPRAEVAVQTGLIREGSVELNISRLRDPSQILDVDMTQAAKFRLHATEHREIGMACIAGVIGRDEVILKMRGGEITLIVEVEALSEILQDKARETKARRRGAVQM